MRHNAVRNLEAELLQEVCHDVKIEPKLIPANQNFHDSTNNSENARGQENEKKRQYNDRVINVKRATFTPLVFSTSGGMGKECEAFSQRISQLISRKRDETYTNVMSYIRTRLRFAILKSTLISIRGVRGKQREYTRNIGQISFNLIPGEEVEDLVVK
eukprot:gene13415-14791_t